MHEFLFFLIGLMIGGTVGVVMMCLLQINRLNDNDRKDGDNDETHRYMG